MEQRAQLSFGRLIIFGYQVEKLASFYIDNFGLTVTEEIKGQWIVLNAGKVEIAIHKVGQGYEPADGVPFRAESNTKLVFYLSGSLEDFRQQLADKGVVIGKVTSFAGINSLFCDGEDPEGNVFQIEQRLGGGAGA